MYAEEINYLCCPLTKERLRIEEISVQEADGEILEGKLASILSGNIYQIINGIPRFVKDKEYNKTWDYKWTAIDAGKGLNYRVADKNDPAYEIHDIFDRNNYGGQAYLPVKGKVVLDIGCGVGQNSWRILKEFAPEKVIAMDLTGGVDIFRKIMLERFPEFKGKLLLIQASVFEMPFKEETFDYVMSLGVLHHTGNTRQAIKNAAGVVKENGYLNFWVYAPELVHIDIREKGRSGVRTLVSFIPYQLYYIWVMFQINLFRRLPHSIVVAILRIFSSNLWYRICALPYIGFAARTFFGTVMHQDQDYRLINNYDGWCNTWAETWAEQELFPTLKEANIVIKGISEWRTGFWGIKNKSFYV